MPKKKLSPPTWDEQNQRWKKVAYCNNMSKTFYSKRRGVTSAEKEITAAINSWKDKMEGLTGCGKLTPMSRVKEDNVKNKAPASPPRPLFFYSASSSSSFVNLVYSITACSYVSQSFSSLAFTTHVLTLCSFFIINSFFMLLPLSDFRLPVLCWDGIFLFDYCQDLCVSNNDFVFVPSIFPMIISADQKGLVSIISF